MVGYVKTPRGLRCLNTVWAQHLSEEAKRITRTGANPRRRPLPSIPGNWRVMRGRRISSQLEKLKKYSFVVRIIVSFAIC